MHQFINRMGSRPTAESKSSLGRQRDKIFKAISSFNADAVKYLGIDAFNECCYESIDICGTDFEEEWDDPIDPPVDDIPTDSARPESSSIALPSALPQQSAHRLSLSRLINTELELRKGHANDCLAEIRTIIGQQAFQYKKILRPAHNKALRTRARSSIQNVQRTLTLKSRLYKRTRKAMLSLDVELDSVYKELTNNDIKVSTAVDSPNVAGSTRTQLSWIWTSHQGVVTADDNHLTECKLYSILSVLGSPNKTVYRVHWLRARAQLHRWQEEVALTRNEMHWTINYFTSRQRQWFLWQYSHYEMTPGHHVYAERQKAMWAEIREQARRSFKDIWADFGSDETVFI
jgi:hypothetical protein